FRYHRDHPALPSLPTRRSSDLEDPPLDDLSHLEGRPGRFTREQGREIFLLVLVLGVTHWFDPFSTGGRRPESGRRGLGFRALRRDRKSTRLNSSHGSTSYPVFS